MWSKPMLAAPFSTLPRALRKYGYWVAGALMIGVAAWVRFDGLGRWGLWRDEAICFFLSQKSFPMGIIDALRHEAHPPLYYFMEHFWVPLVGSTEFRIRLLSFGPGALAIPLWLVAGRRMFGPLAGLAAALIGAFAPLHIMMSQTARMYALLALLSLLSVWLLHEAWQKGGWWWAGYVIATIGVIYTHNWGLFLLAAQNGFALWQMAVQKEWRRRLIPWLMTQTVIGLAYLPWLPILLAQLQIIVVLPFVPIPTPAEKAWELAGVLLARWPAMLLWLGLLGLGLWPRKGQAFAERSGALALVIFCSLGTLGLGLLISLRTYGQIPVYVTLSAYPALCLLLGRGLARLRPVWITLPLAALVIFFSIQDLPRTRFLLKSTLREVAYTVQAGAGPQDMIVIAPDYLAPTFNFYFKGAQPQIAFPWWMERLEWIDCYGWPEKWQRAAEAVPATLEAIEAQLGPAGRLWLVVAPDEHPTDVVYYEQVRRLKQEIEARYQLERSEQRFRNATEWADVHIYRRTGG